MLHTDDKPWNPITLDIYHSTDKVAQATLYEDDRVTGAYREGDCRFTQFTVTPDAANKTVTVSINGALGNYTNALEERAWIVRMRIPSGWGDSLNAVTVDGQETSWETYAIDQSTIPFQASGSVRDNKILEVTVPSVSLTSKRTVIFFFDEMISIQTPVTTLQKVTLYPTSDRNIVMNMFGRPVGHCKVSFTVLSLKGQQISHAIQSTIQNRIVFPVTGKAGSAIAKGTYLFRLIIEQKDMVKFQNAGKVILY